VDIDPAVTLRVPAESAYVALIRAAVSAMCARLDFTIDRIEDIKLAVAESAALLLSDASPGADLDVRFTPDAPDGLRVDEVVATVSPDRALRIVLTAHRTEAVRP
jgi:serine/threonine-protein kinase RsbW